MTFLAQSSSGFFDCQQTLMGNCCMLRAPALTNKIMDELFYYEEHPDKLPDAMTAHYNLVEDCKIVVLL